MLIIDAEEVGNLVDDRDFYFFFDFSRRVAFVLDWALKNQYPVRVEGLFKVAALGQWDPFVQTEERFLAG
jgi:hypothetical protein